MHLMPLHIDGREGTRRTDILTGTTADAGRFVDSRHHGRLLVVRIERHHLDGARRTMAGTVATIHLVCQHHTVLLDPNGMTNLDGGFLWFVDELDGSGRTNLRTACTLRTAVTMLVRHLRQHQVHQVGRGTKHVVGTL